MSPSPKTNTNSPSDQSVKAILPFTVPSSETSISHGWDRRNNGNHFRRSGILRCYGVDAFSSSDPASAGPGEYGHRQYDSYLYRTGEEFHGSGIQIAGSDFQRKDPNPQVLGLYLIETAYPTYFTLHKIRQPTGSYEQQPRGLSQLRFCIPSSECPKTVEQMQYEEEDESVPAATSQAAAYLLFERSAPSDRPFPSVQKYWPHEGNHFASLVYWGKEEQDSWHDGKLKTPNFTVIWGLGQSSGKE